MPVDKMLIKLFGLQRSGTNYIADMAERHFPATVVQSTGARWKHATPAPGPIDPLHWGKQWPDGYLLIVKSPGAWLSSMLRYSRAPTRDPYALAFMWNVHVYYALRFKAPNTCKLFYNHCLADEWAVLRAMAKAWNLEEPPALLHRRKVFRRCNEHTPPDERTTGDVFDKGYYLEMAYQKDLQEKLTDFQRELYADTIQWDLFTRVCREFGPTLRQEAVYYSPFRNQTVFNDALTIGKDPLEAPEESPGDDTPGRMVGD